MIYAELTGGLGNQMFVYAFARALGLRCGEPVTLLDRQDWREGAPAHTRCGLEDLCISPQVAICGEPAFAKHHLPLQNAAKTLMIKREQRGGMQNRDWRPFEARMAPLLNRLGLHFVTEGYIPARRGRLPRDFLAWGYFQAEGYFADQAPAIRRELRTRGPLSPEGAAFADAIRASACPVCLHWRCGDYRRPENAALQVCTPAYYAAACRRVARELPGAELFLFSDEPDWAMTHLDPAGLPVHPAAPHSAAEDLALMQLCRHFILSNSTFSWWAQYLGDFPGKRVFAPGRWYANGKVSSLLEGASSWEIVRDREG